MRWEVGTALGLAAALVLAGCDRGASAPARSHEAADGGTRIDGGASSSGAASSSDDRPSYASRERRYGERRGGEDGDAPERVREAVPLFKGEPMWADNRRHTAEENAKYHCDKSGPDIGASTLDACLTKVHAFIDHPPAGVETMTRSNGDRLIYDPKANLFAVARKDGAPRTFFKPRDGADYWKQQQEEGKSGGYHRRYGGGGDDSQSG